MAITTAAEFFAGLEKSRLLADEQLAEARGVAGQLTDPTAIAKLLTRHGLITPWQAGGLLAGLTAFFMGKYKLLNLLGRGGMGSVFLAEHTTMNRRVALKVVSRQIGKDRASLERFFAEARAIAALDHPNIVQAYSVDNEGDRYYIVMEYVAGQDLQHLVEREGPLECGRAANYIAQAAEGLAHAHARNMIHCDIKPSNLLVNPQGVVKILDMGLARLVGRGSEPERPDERILGSVDYLSPEQALGAPGVDHRADIYSLGCTFYFLLIGHPPFPDGTLHQRILKHQTQQPRSIRSLRPNTPPELVDICAKMMAKRPEERFQLAAEISRALQQWKSASQSKAVVVLPAVEQESGKAAAAAAKKPSSSPGKPRAPGARQSGETPAVKKSPSDAAETTTAKPAGGVRFQPRQWLAAGGWKIALVAGAALAGSLVVGATIMMLSGEKSKTTAATELNSPRDGNKKGVGRKPDPIAEWAERAQQEQKAPAPATKSEEPKSESPKTPPSKPSPSPPAALPAAKITPPQPKVAQAPPQKVEPKPQPQPPVQAAPVPPPQPPPAPPPAAKPVDVLAGLRPAALPAVAAGKSVSLGTVALPPAGSLGMNVLNGEGAGRDTPKFVLRQSGDPAGKESWIIAIASSGAEKDASAAADVARLWLEAKELKFGWLKSADAKADSLRNCGVLIAVGGASRFLPFSLPVEKAAQMVDLDKGTVKVDLKRSSLPDAAAIRLQVLGLDGGQFPAHQLKVEAAAAGRKPNKGAPEAASPDTTPIPAKGKADVLFLDPTLSNYGLRISFDVKGRAASVSVSVIHKAANVSTLAPATHKAAALSARPRAPHESPYVPFRHGEMIATKRQIKAAQAQWFNVAANSKDAKAKKAAQDQLILLDEQENQINAIYQAVKKASDLQFRIYTEVGGEGQTQKVDLFRIAPEGAQKPAAAEAAPSNLRRELVNLRP